MKKDPSKFIEAMKKHTEEIMKKPIVKHDFQVKNCISHWYPKIEDLVKTPETLIINTDFGLYEMYSLIEDNPTEEQIEKFDKLLCGLRVGCNLLGYPAFIKTGDNSGKHSWKDTCFIENRDTDLKDHILNLVNDSGLKDLCTDVWCVREFIDTKPAFYAFGGTPITRERRFFINNGIVLTDIPYWPENAIEGHSPSEVDWKDRLAELSKLKPIDELHLYAETQKVADVFEGFWSVDWLETAEGGWCLIDMALGNMSWGKENALPFIDHGDSI